jgi:hypothetical protein
MDRETRSTLDIPGSASPAQAAAIAAAIESFAHDAMGARARAWAAGEGGAGADDAWTRAAMLEGVARAGAAIEGGVPDPWINT